VSTVAHILALLGDLAGARDVLQDARLEERPADLLADLERVRQEAEDALWGEAPSGYVKPSSRRAPCTMPRFVIHEYEDDFAPVERPMSPGEQHGCRIRTAFQWRAIDWLAWNNGGAAMGRSWAPGFYGIPPGMAGPMASFADIYRAPYATLDEAAADIASAGGGEPDVIYMNPENYRLYQEECERSARAFRSRRLRERVADRVRECAPSAVVDRYLSGAQAEVNDLYMRCGARPSADLIDEAVIAISVCAVLEREMAGEVNRALHGARRRREAALEAIRRSVGPVVNGTFTIPPGTPVRFGGVEPMAASHTDPRAFSLPSPGWWALTSPSHPDDIFNDGRVWSRNLVPIPAPREDDPIETAMSRYTNLLATGPGPIGGHLYEDDEENL
jgi:hypothetical protein